MAGAWVTPSLRLTRKLGDGGMSEVWVAEHKTLGTEVVVKFLSSALLEHPDAIARFTREATLAAQVRHPHVVQVFDHGFGEDGIPFIAMELLEGYDLAEHLARRGRLPPPEVSAILEQVGKALRRVHELGLVHRDVKPENIFLCDLGTGEPFVKLLDFGIAKVRSDLASSLTATGIAVGTPFYMSPEAVLSTKHVDASADLWALAVVAFEALTGLRPFQAETVAGVALQLHAPERPLPSKIAPDLPPELDAWFARAFALDARERFADVRSMVKAFTAVVPAAARSIAPPPVPDSAPLERSGAETLPVQVTAPPRERSARRASASAVLGVTLAFASIATGLEVARRDRVVPASVEAASEAVKHASTAGSAKEPAPASAQATTSAQTGAASAPAMPPSALETAKAPAPKPSGSASLTSTSSTSTDMIPVSAKTPASKLDPKPPTVLKDFDDVQ